MKTVATIGSETRTQHDCVNYPTLAGVLPTSLTIYDQISPQYFRNPNCRLVVGVLLHDGEAVYLAESAKLPKERAVPTFPQEKAKLGKDGTFRSTLVRCLQEELGVTNERSLKFHSKALFQFENHLPLDRTEGVPTTKPIVYFAVRIPKNLRLVPNPAELRGVERVVADDFLDRDCASRVEKRAAQIEAVLAGIREKVLDPQQWGSFSRMYQAKQAA